ncbi:hypothetical protein N0V87_007844 [Didymella glomerata]|jgi:hypothetical protein|uniref:Uncharacterized protein n=1 Tax=Didymella glomerata TaxID=749621 RepID=A0A9W8WU33_9PLEO|nr:hypothetical protein N0V87_007844 [Didymella glomerata]
MSSSDPALHYSVQTSPYANFSKSFTHNATDPCMRHANVILRPLDFSGTAYVATGPISNFSSLFQSCCPNKTANAIQNYNGGNNRGNAPEYDSPLECFYYCSFNGTSHDVGAALNCTKQKAEENGDHDRYILAAGPDSPSESRGVQVGAKTGAWKWAVLGLVVVGAVGL